MSKKYKSTIDRKLQGLDIDIEMIPMSNLLEIKYPVSFGLTRGQFEYLLSNSGIYAEILNVAVTSNPNTVEFSEAGQIGNSSIFWEKKKIPYLSIDFSKLQGRLKELQGQLVDEEKEGEPDHLTTQIEKLREEIENKRVKAEYSITFLRSVGKMCPLLEERETIHFSLRNIHPIKVEADFSPLGNAHFEFFLAARAEETEFDEDDLEEF
jgi:hypothetical protein